MHQSKWLKRGGTGPMLPVHPGQSFASSSETSATINTNTQFPPQPPHRPFQPPDSAAPNDTPPMSLFGNLGGGGTTSSGSTPSLFAGLGGASNTNPSQASSEGGLFGNTSTSQAGSTGGGLFGNLGGNKPATSQAGGGGLFGSTLGSNATTSQAGGSGGGLFGNLGGGTSQSASTSAGSGGLFAGLGGSTTATSSAPSGGLFSGLGSSTATSKPATTGLFGGLGASTTTSQPAGTGGGLFSGLGASTTTSQPQQGGLFAGLGSTTTGTSQAQQGGGPFGSTLGASTQQNAQNQANQQQPVAGNPQTAYFESLLERGRKRNNQEKTNETGLFTDLPSLQLNLGDIARKARNLGSGGPTAAEAKAGDGSRAHYLLAASGVSTASALRDLNSFSAQAGVSAGPGYPQETDLDGYINNLHQQTTLDLIADGLEQSRRDFDAFLEDNVQMEWDEQRKRIYEHFGLSKSDENDPQAAFSGTQSTRGGGAFGRSSRRARSSIATSKSAANGRMSFGPSMGRSIIGAAASKNLGRSSTFNDVSDAAQANSLQAPSEGRMFRDKQEKFAEKVKQFNEARVREEVFPILHAFAEVEGQTGIDTSNNLVDAYKALIEITGEQSQTMSRSTQGVVKERQYREAYLDDAPNSQNSITLRKRIIDGSRRYLEKRFLRAVDETISKNTREAALGGIPSAVNRIKGYVRVLTARKELGDKTDTFKKIGDEYAWVTVFYLLRSGLVDDAVKYVAYNDKAFKNLDALFVLGLGQYAKDQSRRLPRETQGKVNTKIGNFKNAAEGTIDPYHYACLKIIGRCELNKRTLDGVRTDMDDWIWLHFALAREANRVEESAGEVFNLQNLKTTVADIGKRHFSPGSESGSSFGAFFYLQILAGMFEEAVSYLYQHNPVAAVHFAIGLDVYGLLRVSDYSNSANLKSYTTTGKPQIAFGPLVGFYTRDFRAAKAEAAADYLILLCLNSDLPGEAGRQQAEMCHESLRELVLETREFASLLGDIRSDGQRMGGHIEQRLRLIGLKDQQAFLKAVTVQAAKVADDSGRTTDAVLLYHLAEDYESVVTVLNRALSESLSLSLGSGAMRIEPLKPRSGTQQNSSLSLTSVDDPVQLANNMVSLYQSNAVQMAKISRNNRDTCATLLQMCRIRSLVEAGKDNEALDKIQGLGLLPTDANNDITRIRQKAQNFNSLPPMIARNIGNLLLWTINCCSRLREDIMSSNFYGSDATRQDLSRRLVEQAKDLMVFAGLVRFRLPAEVMEILAREGTEAGYA